MNKAKMALLVLAAVAVSVAAGFLWGAWGRWGLEGELRETRQRLWLAEASGALYAARIDLTELNYGKAGGTIERARKVMATLAGEYESAARPEAAAAVREAIARAGEAQQAAASVDQAAAGRVADALKALARVEAAPAR